MAKRIKKNTSNAKKTDKRINGKKNRQKKALTEDRKNEHKPAIVKDRNLRFKNKSTKNKLTKKIKQIHKNKENRGSNFLNTDVIKVVNLRNTNRNKITGRFQKKNEYQINDKQKQKQHNKRNKTFDQPKNKINDDKKSMKKTKLKPAKRKVEQKQKLSNKITRLSSVLEKKLTQKKNKISNSLQKKNDSQVAANHHNLDIKRLEKLLANTRREKKKEKIDVKRQPVIQTLRTRLKAFKFRYLNETLYNNESTESKKYFKDDPDAFKAYHEGYKQQVEQWPLNPLDVIISSIKKMPKKYIIADFGCGEAKLAASVPHKVHSFDFISLNKNVTCCDMAHTPLLTSGVDVVVFCLSLMGTNLKDYITEANRVLKKNGILKIAEIESRFEQVEDFIKAVSSYGFKNTWKDLSHNMFYFLDFKKEKDINSKKSKLPPITLKSCLYKKR